MRCAALPLCHHHHRPLLRLLHPHHHRRPLPVQAFEGFRRSYRKGALIEENKATLRQRYEEAKALGESVNGARACINALKGRVETCRQKRAAAGVADGGGGALPSPEEEALVAELDGEKRKYKEGFAKLRELKGEIEHLQHLLEQARARAPHLSARPPVSARDPRPPSFPSPISHPGFPLPLASSRGGSCSSFERWFAAQEASKVDPGADAAPLAAALPGGMGGVARRARRGTRRCARAPRRARAAAASLCRRRSAGRRCGRRRRAGADAFGGGPRDSGVLQRAAHARRRAGGGEVTGERGSQGYDLEHAVAPHSARSAARLLGDRRAARRSRRFCMPHLLAPRRRRRRRRARPRRRRRRLRVHRRQRRPHVRHPSDDRRRRRRRRRPAAADEKTLAPSNPGAPRRR